MGALGKRICSVWIIIILILFNGCSFQKNNTEVKNTPIPQQGEKKESKENAVPSKGGTLNLQSIVPDTLNPLLTKSVSNIQALSLIYEGLIKLDKNMNIVPVLAKKWDASPDGLTWTFSLREGVNWHDGVQFTANDVDFTFRMIASNKYNSVYKQNMQHIISFAPVGQYAFKVVLDQPYASFLSMMSFPIMPKHQFGTDFDKGQQNFQPIGTGPYKFVEYDSSKELKLSANDGWWNEDIPYIDTILVKLLPDHNTALSALESKEVDMVPTDIVDLGKYGNKNNIQIKEYPTNEYTFIGFNFNNKILSNQAVRKAIAFATDKNKIINEALLGHAKESDVPISPESWLYDSSSKIYSTDIQKAKEILVNDGWADSNSDGIFDKIIDGVAVPLSFSILVNEDNPIKNKVAEMIVNQLANAGIVVNLKKVAWDEFNKLIAEKKFDAALSSVNLSVNQDLTFAFHSNATHSGTNFIGYKNPEMDQLLQNVLMQSNNDSKKQAYSELEKYIAEDLPYLSLYFKTSAVLYNGKLKGDINSLDTNIYNDINKWYLAKE